MVVFVPEAQIERGWSAGTPFILNCPVCGYDYNHAGDPITVDSLDAYKAWSGRGDCVKVPFSCEQGHRYALCFGQHKGQTILFWEYPL